MVSFETIGTVTIVLAIIIGGYYYWKPKPNAKLLGPLVMVRTKKGVRLIDRIAKFAPRFWKFFGNAGFIIGFLFMILLVLTLVQNLFTFIQSPSNAVASAQIIVPGITTPLIAGLIAIIVLAVSHELSHGIQARNDGIKVKTTGPLFLGFIPIGAFVEPDEKEVKRAPTRTQLRMFAAGSFMNIVLAIIFLAVFAYAFIPHVMSPVQGGILLTNVVEESPAESFGLEKGMIINQVNDIEIGNQIDFARAIYNLDLQAGDQVILESKTGEIFNIEAANRNGRGWIGIEACGEIPPKYIFGIGFGNPIALKNLPINPECYTVSSALPENVIWFGYSVLLWNIILNFGVGLFNLLPLKPLDGGLMIEAVANKFSPNKFIAKKIVRILAYTILFLLLINIFGPIIF